MEPQQQQQQQQQHQQPQQQPQQTIPTSEPFPLHETQLSMPTPSSSPQYPHPQPQQKQNSLFHRIAYLPSDILTLLFAFRRPSLGQSLWVDIFCPFTNRIRLALDNFHPFFHSIQPIYQQRYLHVKSLDAIENHQHHHQHHPVVVDV